MSAAQVRLRNLRKVLEAHIYYWKVLADTTSVLESFRYDTRNAVNGIGSEERCIELLRYVSVFIACASSFHVIRCTSIASNTGSRTSAVDVKAKREGAVRVGVAKCQLRLLGRICEEQYV